MDERPQRFTEAIVEMLHQAGWRSGRDVMATVQLPRGFRLFPAAARVLAEFGNLRMGRHGPGLEMARRTVRIDPMLALGENEEFAQVETVIGCALYPLGEINEGQAFVAIDEQGRTFIVGDLLLYVDANFDDALDRLLTGKSAVRIDTDEPWSGV